jgi:YD repeat-containing protein
MQSKVDELSWQTTAFAWDGSGRTTRVATNGRASQTKYDVAGRPLQHAEGAGSLANLAETFSATTVQSHDGDLPTQSTVTEKNGVPIASSQSHNVAGDVSEETVGSLSWKRAFDQLGAVTSASVPGRKPTQWTVDARGAAKDETLPDGAQNQFEYDASGAPSRYRDPEGEATSTITDLAGRPTRRTYADGTFEATTWEGARVKSVTDRQGRTQTYAYNSKGQLTEIRDDAGLTDLLAYDEAGRLSSWRNADAEILWADFNLAGAPKKTTQRRFRDRSGLTTRVVLDEFVQTHAWNEHGERTDYTMPAYPGMTPAAGWTTSVHQSYDAMGNVTGISRGDMLMSAQYRNAGRPDARTITTKADANVTRAYGYDATTAQLTSLAVAANGITVAGSEVTYDGLQLPSARLLGVSSGERFMQWRYDDRSRLLLSLAGVAPDTDPFAPAPGRVTEDLTQADYRLAQQRLPQFDGPTTDVLKAKGIDTSELDPPSSHFERRPGGGHKIGEFAQGETVRPFDWNGSQRIDDGRFIYGFDAKGRLIRATERHSARHHHAMQPDHAERHPPIERCRNPKRA